jgi:hypothetical protein
MKREHLNTCNAWGFGGVDGVLTTYENGIQVFSGKRYYRHSKPSNEKWVRYIHPETLKDKVVIVNGPLNSYDKITELHVMKYFDYKMLVTHKTDSIKTTHGVYEYYETIKI